MRKIAAVNFDKEQIEKRKRDYLTVASDVYDALIEYEPIVVFYTKTLLFEIDTVKCVFEDVSTDYEERKSAILAIANHIEQVINLTAEETHALSTRFQKLSVLHKKFNIPNSLHAHLIIMIRNIV